MLGKKLHTTMYAIGRHLHFLKGVPCSKPLYEALVLNPMSFPFVASCSSEIKGKTFDDIGSLLDYSSACCEGLIKAIQVREEITALLRLLQERKPKRMMEIGTANGGTLFLFCKMVDSGATIISLDLGGYPSARIPLYKRFATGAQKMHLLRGDSHLEESRQKVKAILGGEQLDFLFIDGDHSYEGVKKDFEMYSPFVKKGGMIAFHDILTHPPEHQCGVEQLWNEVKKGRDYKEFAKDRKQGWAGIGVLFV